MQALTKFSLALLLLTAIAVTVYLYVVPGDESFDGARSDPQSAICKHDGERLARLRARPSLSEGLRFVGEIRCMQLWPQLQTLLDNLSDPSRSTASSKLDRAGSDTTPGRDAASPPGATSADACEHDEDRLAELRANPSVDAAILFDNELKCPRLKPQLLEILTQLSRSRGSVQAASRNASAPDSMSASAPAPLALEPPASEAAASEDACKKDEERLAELQAKPSLNEAMRLENEFNCLKLQPQLLALLDKLIQAPQPAGTQSPNGAPPNRTSGIEAAPPAAEPPGSAASELACKQDEERMARLRTTPSSEGAARFTQEPRCETLRPELLALTAALASPPESARMSKDAGAEMNAANETPPAPQAAADAERRIAELESEKEELAAEVNRLQHDRKAPLAEEAKSPPAPPRGQTKGSVSDSLTALASLPTGMPARVLIRYLPNNADARAQAEMLAGALQRQGIEVADLRESRSAIRPELSFSYAPDEAIAQQVGRLVGVAPVRRPQPKDGLMVRPGTVELNLSGDSHLAAIKTTSTRESNHE
jgi:hypothetical protein